MNFFRNLFLTFKNIFRKHTEIKQLEAPKQFSTSINRDSFIKDLKVNVKKKKKIETLVCEGDGLGIQRKMTY